ncbi:MAG: hypothetical protein RL545_846 [Actinomycetota bacterium]|jgi:hypothetical protein
MWIFTETGFVSAVKKPQDAGLVSLRARNHASLEAIAAKYSTQIINTPSGDYPWRTFISNEQLAEWLSETALNLDYSNFKSRAHKTNKSSKFINALHDVWAVMTHTEDSNARPRRQGDIGPSDAELRWIDQDSKG